MVGVLREEGKFLSRRGECFWLSSVSYHVRDWRSISGIPLSPVCMDQVCDNEVRPGLVLS